MAVLISIVCGIALIAGILFILRRAGAGGALEDELISLCLGDRKMMERLISLEEKRGGGRNRKAAIEAAIVRLKRDNR